jgi:hypothetical protein
MFNFKNIILGEMKMKSEKGVVAIGVVIMVLGLSAWLGAFIFHDAAELKKVNPVQIATQAREADPNAK